jgi:hypothetical protein
MKTDEKRLAAVCGLFCGGCDIYLASHGDRELQRRIGENVSQVTSREIKPKEIKCEGCWGPLEVHWSADCKMLNCARERGYRFCFECEEYPCDKLIMFKDKHYPHVLDNLNRIRQIGVESWLKEQKEKKHSRK